MINKVIKDALRGLNINSYYQRTTSKDDKYIVFKVYNEQDSDICDEINLSESYFITVNYWYKDSKDYPLYKDIINSLKLSGFIFDGCEDIEDESYYGKNIDFIYNKVL